MKATALALMVFVTACASGKSVFGRGPRDARTEALYWNALGHLDAANKQASVDSALVYLDSYLVTGRNQTHRREALVLQQLARQSQQLARVQAALQHSRAETKPDSTAPAAPPARTEADARRRDEETVKEIQRLKDELAKANEELDRIRKRLAAPKPPGTPP
jgi:hypothetical protein